MSLLNIIAGNSYWIINKTLARAIGVETALLYSDLAQAQLYWDKKKGGASKYFFKVEEDIEEDTTLSSHKQRKGRKLLKEAGLLKTKRKGVPAKIYYLIDQECIKNLLLKFLTTGSREIEGLEAKEFNTTNNKELIIDTNNKKDTIYTEEEGGEPKKEIPYLLELEQILLLFEELTGRGFRIPPASKVLRYGAYKKVAAVLRAGYSLEEVLEVIQKKYKDWKDSKKYSVYIRYETLLANVEKFEKYLGEVSITKKLGNNNSSYEKRTTTTNKEESIQDRLDKILEQSRKEGFI
jgi:uncharacterized phage protein (TIGR02220 family)